MTEEFGRRAFMTTLSLAGIALPMGAATAASGPKLRSDAQNNLLLEDPSRRARVRARIMGSTAKETVNIFYRLHIYGFMGDGSMIPLFTLNHLSVNKWKPLPDDKYESTTYECGVYCKFDTDEPLEEWVNPVTHEKRKVWHFYGGPFTVTIGADGIVTKGADIEPVPLHMESIGGMVFIPTAAAMARPNPISIEKYPDLSSGPISYWETMSTTGASAVHAFDETLTSAPAFHQFQNLGSWHPWIGMGQRPGRTYGKAHGAKIASLDEIPASARRGLEKYTPDIFDTENWTKPRLDILEYVQQYSKK